MKRVTFRKRNEINADGTHINELETTEEITNNGLTETAVAFAVFLGLFLGSVYAVRVMFAPSPMSQPENELSTSTQQI